MTAVILLDRKGRTEWQKYKGILLGAVNILFLGLKRGKNRYFLKGHLNALCYKTMGEETGYIVGV